jgi:hypothetical protein
LNAASNASCSFSISISFSRSHHFGLLRGNERIVIFLRHVAIPEVFIARQPISSIFPVKAKEGTHAVLEVIPATEARARLGIAVLHPLVDPEITLAADTLRLNLVLFRPEAENLTRVAFPAPTVEARHLCLVRRTLPHFFFEVLVQFRGDAPIFAHQIQLFDELDNFVKSLMHERFGNVVQINIDHLRDGYQFLFACHYFDSNLCS